MYLTPVSLDVARFVGDTVLVPAHGTGARRAKTALGELPAQDPTSSGRRACSCSVRRTCRSPGTAPYSRAAVSSVSYHGRFDTLLAARAGSRLLIRVLGRQAVAAGDDVTVRVTHGPESSSADPGVGPPPNRRRADSTIDRSSVSPYQTGSANQWEVPVAATVVVAEFQGFLARCVTAD